MEAVEASGGIRPYRFEPIRREPVEDGGEGDEPQLLPDTSQKIRVGNTEWLVLIYVTLKWTLYSIYLYFSPGSYQYMLYALFSSVLMLEFHLTGVNVASVRL